MNIYEQMQDLFPEAPRGVATITAQRGGGVVVAQTPPGVTILLNGTAATGKTVYYNQKTHDILGEAPALTYTEIGV